MPVHDWRAEDAGVFHSLHLSWLCHLSGTLNNGGLPECHYSLTEFSTGSEVVAEEIVDEETTYLNRRRSLIIRHLNGHRIVARVEVVTPGNKKSAARIREFATGINEALTRGIHVVVLDLFPSADHAPDGIHGAVWALRGNDEPHAPEGQPIVLSSYFAVSHASACVEHVALRQPLPEMPLFLDTMTYVPVPLETTYQAAFRGMPGFIQQRLESQA